MNLQGRAYGLWNLLTARFCLHYLRPIVQWMSKVVPHGPVWAASATRFEMLWEPCENSVLCEIAVYICIYIYIYIYTAEPEGKVSGIT